MKQAEPLGVYMVFGTLAATLGETIAIVIPMGLKSIKIDLIPKFRREGCHFSALKPSFYDN